jgi:hemoglobin/transferrin/lactoferrin receptor protein
LFNGVKNIDLYGNATTDNLSEALFGIGTPAWWTWNLETTHDISEALHLQAGIHNILDVHYKPFASGISAPGRGVYVAVNANF